MYAVPVAAARRAVKVRTAVADGETGGNLCLKEGRRSHKIARMRTIDLLLDQLRMPVDELASRANLPIERVEAIALGRWTPSPSERQRVAAALGVRVDEISWGHTMDPRNVRYRRFGFDDQERVDDTP